MSDIVNTEQTTDEPLTKPKRERTAKQLEAFEKVKQKRQQNIEIKKQQKLLESAKLLVENETKKKEEVSKPQPQPQSQPKLKPQPKQKEVLQEYTEAEDSEEEVIIVKKAKPKKKVRKVIIESDSDSGNESDDESEPLQPVRIMRPNVDYGDFFC